MAGVNVLKNAKEAAADFQHSLVRIPVQDNGLITQYVAISKDSLGGRFLPLQAEAMGKRKLSDPLADKSEILSISREFFLKKGFSKEQVRDMLRRRFFLTYQVGEEGEDIILFIDPAAWSRYGKHLGFGDMPERVTVLQGLAMTEQLYKTDNYLRIEAVRVGRDAFMAVGFFSYKNEMGEEKTDGLKTEDILDSFKKIGEKNLSVIDYQFEPHLSYVTAVKTGTREVGGLRPAIRCMTSDTGMFADRLDAGLAYGDTGLFFPVREYSVRGKKTKYFDRERDLIKPFRECYKEYCTACMQVLEGLSRWVKEPTSHAGDDADGLLGTAHLWDAKYAGRRRRESYMEEGYFSACDGTGADTLEIMMQICEELNRENRDWLCIRKVCPEMGKLLWGLGQ